ncbi:hypothetical protein TWF506_003179 [Arthrobotrys conoides]|uniref:F-box domain-containing protein n=1 Tax=Arthrobotrys conoides TaxID=74498 RepID=A0AAN8P7E3_9PEZI
MANILSIPLEILFLVAGNLPVEDIKSLRLACRELNEKAAGVYDEALFTCRTYFATIPDLEALLELTRHPSGANLRLKHLKINVASPYVHIKPNLLLNSLGDDDEEDELRPPKLFNRTCFAFDCHNFEGLRQSEDQALIFAALQNLPNLEVIEFIDQQGMPSEKALAKHYPLSTSPEYKEQFIAFYKDHNVRQRRDRMTTLLFYVMAALKHAPCRIKELLVDSPQQRYMYASLGWFDSHRRHISRLGQSLENLRVLELNLCYPWPPEDHRDFDDFGPIKLTEGELRCLPDFLTNTVPNIEKLRLNFAEILPELNTNNLHVWMRPEARKYEPTFFLKNMEIHLPRIKRLELLGIPFIPNDLIEVLLRPHKSTLRHLLFEDCVLQETPQCWSTIFSLLKEELTLETFSFHTKTVHRRISLVGKMPHVFKVQGHVRDEKHTCEVQSSGKKPLISTTYWEALDIIVDFEAKLLDPSSASDPPPRSQTDYHFFDDNSSSSSNPSEQGDWPINVWDDLDDDFDDADDDGMGHIGHIGPIGPIGIGALPGPLPLPLPPLPAGLNGIIPPFPMPGALPRTYQANQPPRLQFAHADPTGHLVMPGTVPPTTFPPGSVVVQDFVVPGTMLNITAMDGQPATVQNIIRNLLPNALDVGVNPVLGATIGAPSFAASTAAAAASGSSTAGPSTAGPSTAGPSTAGPSVAGPSATGPINSQPLDFQTALQILGLANTNSEQGPSNNIPPCPQQ